MSVRGLGIGDWWLGTIHNPQIFLFSTIFTLQVKKVIYLNKSKYKKLYKINNKNENKIIRKNET